MVRIIPRDAKFFDMFADMANNLTDGARVLMNILKDYDLEGVLGAHNGLRGAMVYEQGGCLANLPFGQVWACSFQPAGGSISGTPTRPFRSIQLRMPLPR